jgi:hypothetical protein
LSVTYIHLLTLFSFTAVTLGLPKHVKDADVHCEFPTDADDEYVTERGFQPTLPGESTKLSSALALFRAARILSKVLEEVFPAKTSYDLSLKKLSELSDEIDSWSSSLPPHLRLQFAQDKPSTGTVNSRSPLLSLTYHYIRALIQRPAICSSSLGNRSSSAMISMASSSKHTIQIIQLLDERGLCFAFCANRDEVLVLAGFGLLFQGLNLDSNSKILKDNQKMICAVNEMLEKTKAPCAPEFKRVAFSFLPSPPTSKQHSKEKTKEPKPPSLSRHNSDSAVVETQSLSPSSSSSSPRKQLKAIAARLSANSGRKPSLDVVDHRRATVHNISLHPHGVPNQSMPSLQPSTSYNPASMSRSEPARSPINLFSRPSSTSTRPTDAVAPPPSAKPKHRQHPNITNLDYLSFGTEPEQGSRPSTQPIKTEPGPTDWEKLIGSLDNGQTNIYDASYGGPPIDALLDGSSLGTHHTNYSSATLNDLPWSQPSDLWTLCQTQSNTSNQSALTTSSGHAASILSFSTEDGNMNSSTEDFTSVNWNMPSNASGVTTDAYRAIVMPELGHHDDFNFDGGDWDTSGLNL